MYFLKHVPLAEILYNALVKTFILLALGLRLTTSGQRILTKGRIAGDGFFTRTM